MAELQIPLNVKKCLMRKIILKTSLLTAALAIAANGVQADNILIVDFDYHTSSDYAAIEAQIEASGHTVDFVDAQPVDAVANAIAAQDYNQVFVFDVTTSNNLSINDLNALTALHNSARSMVLDGQSYNYTSWDTSDADGINFLTNVANQFSNLGGGIYLGFDHPDDWSRNTNAILGAFGMDLITVEVNSEITSYDLSSPYFDGVTSTNWGASSYGVALSGMQGGQYFDVLATDASGNALISVSAVPEPSTYALMLGGLGLVGFMAARRRKLQA